MKIVRRVCSFIIGFVFLLAGIFKLVDPVGSGLVVSGYFSFFHLNFLDFSSKAVGVALALAESVLGAALLSGVWKKAVAAVSACFLGFFTLLTLILLIFNPSMDCGCFGEVIHLTHLQSFLKNLILDALWAGAFIPFASLQPCGKLKFAGFGIAAVSLAVFSLWALLSIPPMDFTAFAPGNEIVVDGDPSTDAVLSFYNADGEYLDTLITAGPVAVVSVPNPENLSKSRWERIEGFVNGSASGGFTPLLLVASAPSQLPGIVSSPGILGSALYADRRTLLTLNRSNGGVTFISGSQIVRKWPFRSFPTAEKLSSLAASDPVESAIKENTPQRMRLQGFLLYVFAVLLLL